MKHLRQQYHNAMTIIAQMKRGEWEFKGSYQYVDSPAFTCCKAERDGVELWVYGGGFFCKVWERPWELGIFGHFVWHFGAKQGKRALERKMRRRPSDMSGGTA
ncbi:hypothetical protein D3C72_1457030 [compost metagenome]